MKKRRNLAFATVFLLALAFAMLCYFPGPSDTLRFHVVDLWTGKPLTNGTIQVAQTWLRLPLSRRFLGKILQRSRTVPIGDMRAEVTGILRPDPQAYIMIRVPGYEGAFITQHFES